MSTLKTQYNSFAITVEPYVFLPPFGISTALWVFMMSSGIAAAAINKPVDINKLSPTDQESLKTRTASGKRTVTIGYGLPLINAGLIFAYRFYKSRKDITFYDFIFGSKEQFCSILPNLLVISYFMKRVFEGSFIHIYTHKFPSHFQYALGIMYSLQLCVPLLWQKDVLSDKYSSKTNVVKYGAILYGIGFLGNFYHHYLLRKARLVEDGTGKGEHNYVMVNEGLFRYSWTPHYMFELFQDYGIAIASNHMAFYMNAFAITTGLIKRAIETKKWYENEFEDCPDKKAIFPFLL